MGRASGTCPSGAPRPQTAKPLAVPPHDGVRLDEDHGSPPLLPHLGEEDPKESVSRAELGSLDRARQGGQLLPKCEVLKRDHPGAATDQDYLRGDNEICRNVLPQLKMLPV
jgi:hypothetical protein